MMEIWTKRRSIICMMLIVLTILMPFGNYGIVTADTTEENKDIYDRIDEYLSDVVPKTHFPSFSITIVDKDKTLFSKSYGDIGGTDKPYALGSVSKSFTALCIMQLVEQDKVSLNANLSEYLPDATDGDRIKILQLLNHTSGLGEHQNLTNYRIVSEQGVHLYSNVNYSLLGQVIEAVSGKSYEDYVTENIFEPLNLNHTYARPDDAKINGLVQGYENWFGFTLKTDNRYCSDRDAWITIPAGYISSSTEDLGRYLQMYLRGGENIISADSINEMFYNSVMVEDDIPYSYGMGWTLINEPLKQPALRHSGLVENGMSCVYILPENDIGVAMTVNANDYFVGADFADRVGWGVILMLMGDEPNQIGSSEYILRHLMFDGIYLIVIFVSVLPFILLKRYIESLRKDKHRRSIIRLIVVHAVLPIGLLLLTHICFGTPLWVVRAFVPDLFFVIIISVALLLCSGLTKLGLFIKYMNTTT